MDDAAKNRRPTFAEFLTGQRLEAVASQGGFRGDRTTMGIIVTECATVFGMTAVVGRIFANQASTFFVPCYARTEYEHKVFTEMETTASMLAELAPSVVSALDLVIHLERVKAGTPSRIFGTALPIDLTTGRWLEEHGPATIRRESATRLIAYYGGLGAVYGIKFPSRVGALVGRTQDDAEDTEEWREAFAWFCKEYYPEYLVPLGLS